MAVLAFILIETLIRRPSSLISAVGLLVILTVMFFLSNDPRQVSVNLPFAINVFASKAGTIRLYGALNIYLYL